MPGVTRATTTLWTTVVTTTGHAAIREFMNGQELATRLELERRHVNTNIVITGDFAEAVSDLLVYDKVADGPWTLTAVGRYTDTLARQADGSWLLAERKLRFIQGAWDSGRRGRSPTPASDGRSQRMTRW